MSLFRLDAVWSLDLEVGRPISPWEVEEQARRRTPVPAEPRLIQGS
jgi:hypothetical protein